MKEIVFGHYKVTLSDRRDGSVKESEELLQQFTFVTQVHGNRIVEASKLSNEKGIQGVQADGILASLPTKNSYGVYVGDCMPIAILGKRSYCIVHAGWRSLYQGIIHNAVKKLYSHGEDKVDITVYIGPSISKEYFEFGSEAVGLFPSIYISPFGDKYTVDLQGIATSQLQFHGITSKAITVSQECTMSSELYYSARNGESGRFMLGVTYMPT